MVPTFLNAVDAQPIPSCYPPFPTPLSRLFTEVCHLCHGALMRQISWALPETRAPSPSAEERIIPVFTRLHNECGWDDRQPKTRQSNCESTAPSLFLRWYRLPSLGC
jgi:hypothetical protein